ncbi:ABC transporter transmembrane domain-containing protein [Usitatibacter palustris]|uniref:Multidrug export ATP-binding/permease protein n=1 Tax=Usitatibacter palustris TaxID=2732487 RepID=A0A6M4HAB7_9PROT|nr:ABC transporter transmembrane domain-containing protein [Usitatibacter palustris]QJR15798.1 Putative multidrug export ATP-binding/permease protein [Usitatibacter palustris]
MAVWRLAPLFRLLLPYRRRIAVAVVAILISAAMVLVMGQGLKFVIDEGFVRGGEAFLDRALAMLAALIVFLGVVTWIRVYNVYWVGARFTADLRRKVYEHLVTLSPAFYEETRTGEVASRVTNDVTLVEAVMGGTFLYALRMLVTLLGCVVMLFVTSVKLSVLALACMPVVLLPIGLIGIRLRKLSRAVQDRVADVTSHVDETIHEIRTVQAYAHEEAEVGGFTALVERVFQTSIERSGYLALLISAVIVLAFGAVGLLLWVGAHDVFDGQLTSGSLTAFIFYAVIVANATFVLAEVYGEILRAAGASERLLELLATRSSIVAPAQPRHLPQPPLGRVALEDVSFSYPSRPDAKAIEHLSLAIEPGEVVALVGPSGAGKTTVFQLLLRFYDPSSGRVMIDGVDAREVDPRELRSRIAIVSQDPVIFATSVAENVRYGRPGASDDEVRAALEAAYALDFVERLPGGLQSGLGERGVKLSGGQRQRVAIARAILADRAVLLLDEATSALDAESEKAVQLALERLMRGRTTLIIAHRLATVQSAHRIVVMDHGHAVATGTHASLVNDNGLYARLAALQFNISGP